MNAFDLFRESFSDMAVVDADGNTVEGYTLVSGPLDWGIYLACRRCRWAVHFTGRAESGEWPDVDLHAPLREHRCIGWRRFMFWRPR